MVRVRKRLVQLLESLSATEMAKMHAQLIGPRLRALRRERRRLRKQLTAVARDMARLAGHAKPAAKKVRAKKAKPQPVKRRRRRRGKLTIAQRIQRILVRAGKPMRVKEICNALAQQGFPKKQSLINYVNRTLSVTPLFAKSGWGVYTLAKKGAAAPAKKARLKKKAKPLKKRGVGRPRKKAGRRKKKALAAKPAAPRKKAAVTPTPEAPPAGP